MWSLTVTGIFKTAAILCAFPTIIEGKVLVFRLAGWRKEERLKKLKDAFGIKCTSDGAI